MPSSVNFSALREFYSKAKALQLTSMPTLLYSVALSTSLLVICFFSLVSTRATAAPSFDWSVKSKTSHQPLIRLNRQGEFRISIFSDLHFGEEEHGWGIDQDINSTRVMNNILNNENPDFVVINGDIITGENTFLQNSTKYLDMAVNPMVSRGIPWASTYGNHDSQFNLSREALFQEEYKYALSYTAHSPPKVSGVTNYYLPIYPRNSHHRGAPVAILWFFDSQGGAPFQSNDPSNTIPSWVEDSTVSWFQSEQKSIRRRWGNLPSIAFVHIPPTAFLDVQRDFLPKAGDESAHFPGLNDDVPLDSQGDGWQDAPFIQALVNTPNLHSVYSGHDHGNSWCGNWPSEKGQSSGGAEALHVCFCKHTGYGGYGNWNRGSRVVKLSFPKHNAMDVETWVSMESGSIVQRVHLNTTYGVDTYPTDDGE